MKTDIMGIAFDNVTMQEALDKATAILQGDKTCYAVTPNAEIAYEAMKDESLRGLINGADLVLPDGAGVVLASKLLKTPLKQKVAGVDFADGLLGAFGRERKKRLSSRQQARRCRARGGKNARKAPGAHHLRHA